MSDIQPWNITGSYFEVCNCDAICPCRRIDGEAGGNSTTGTCEFAVSWKVTEGEANGIDLAGCSAVIAGYFTDDESMSPWTIVLYIDDRCSEDQASAMERIFLGKAGGDPAKKFAGAFGDVIAVRRVRIELDHTADSQQMKIGEFVDVKIKERFEHAGTITCGLVSHDTPGTEVVAEHMRVNDGKLRWEFLGKCGFASPFAYAS